VQNALTLAKTTALAALILLGLAMWTRVAPAPMVAATAPAPDASLLAGLAGAFVPVLFSIGGWQQMNMVAGEVRDPERIIPRSLFLGIAIVLFVYLGANAVFLHVLGRDGLAASGAVAADTASRLVGGWGAAAITVAAMMSILGIVNVILLANPRVFYAMARDGVFLPFAARIHPRFGTPHWSIALLGGWSLALLLLTRGRIGELLGGVVFADWIFFGLGAASVFALRRKRPDARRPYRAWGYPLLPALFVLAAVLAVAAAIASAPAASLRGALLLALGAPAYAWLRRGRAADARPGSAEERA
jgi:APA family basic amino acid/polyamine antiporter